MATTSKTPEELLGDLLDGYAQIETFAKANDRSVKTIWRWIVRMNLPFIKVGNQVYLNVAGSRAIMTGQKSPAPALPPPRGRGRPRKLIEQRSGCAPEAPASAFTK